MDMKKLKISGILFGCFAFFTILIRFIDRKAVGPLESKVGFSLLNNAVKKVVGYSKMWYALSSFFGIIVILVVVGFAALGIYELIRRKSLTGVDPDLYALAVIYVIMAVFYIVFDKVIVINYRPVLEGEELAASYPSSHTLMAVTVLGTAIIALYKRLKEESTRRVVFACAMLLMLLAVLTRFLSGAHWFTDIIASFLLGASLVALYSALAEYSFILRKQIKQSAQKNKARNRETEYEDD
ncbi:MAG: phosphatase PAP2 family protein [Lachnospiraceae bacterium]|nr:phosphatase PAP2 family protein [Lachnospiraceae bacterium]